MTTATQAVSVLLRHPLALDLLAPGSLCLPGAECIIILKLSKSTAAKEKARISRDGKEENQERNELDHTKPATQDSRDTRRPSL